MSEGLVKRKFMKMSTWNVNGLRACLKKGFLDWLQTENFDIVCLQEVKASCEQLPKEVISPTDYHVNYAVADKKGYSGVALFSKKSMGMPNITIGLGVSKFDREGRTIIAEYPHFTLFAGYFPNGSRDHKRVPYKMEYCREITKKAVFFQINRQKPVIVTGDFNTAHNEIDLANPHSNHNTTGFLSEERAWMSEFIAKGFYDVFRLHHPEEKGHYTWWTYRKDCRQRNIGWRIDYFFLTKPLLDRVKKIYHQPEVMGSDHCPVILELSI